MMINTTEQITEQEYEVLREWAEKTEITGYVIDAISLHISSNNFIKEFLKEIDNLIKFYENKGINKSGTYNLLVKAKRVFLRQIFENQIQILNYQGAFEDYAKEVANLDDFILKLTQENILLKRKLKMYED